MRHRYFLQRLELELKSGHLARRDVIARKTNPRNRKKKKDTFRQQRRYHKQRTQISRVSSKEARLRKNRTKGSLLHKAAMVIAQHPARKDCYNDSTYIQLRSSVANQPSYLPESVSRSFLVCWYAIHHVNDIYAVENSANCNVLLIEWLGKVASRRNDKFEPATSLANTHYSSHVMGNIVWVIVQRNFYENELPLRCARTLIDLVNLFHSAHVDSIAFQNSPCLTPCVADRASSTASESSATYLLKRADRLRSIITEQSNQ